MARRWVRAVTKVRDVDRGWRRLLRVVKQIADDESHVRVGVMDDGGPGSEDRGGITMAILALVLEVGSEIVGIPARPFLRGAFDARRGELEQLTRKVVGKIYDGKMTPREALEVLGAWFAAEVKKFITAGPPIPPPNAPAVAARKEAKGGGGGGRGGPARRDESGRYVARGGGVRTLVDTGRLVASITYKVYTLARGAR